MDESFNGIKLLGDIKSEYIQKGIFSYLNEKRKLKMIMYNKKLQNIFGINIENYKKMSGKYLIFERNGIGILYKLNTNQMIFKGEYLNGEKNGKGKEYYNNGELKFEGEYINGKKNGMEKDII